MTWIQTEDGREFPLLDPQPHHVNFNVIAAATAKLCRFTGHTQCFYSVAQHMVHTTDLVDLEAKPYALLHDAHEAYVGDWSTPLKWAVNDLGGGDAIKRLVTKADQAIFSAAGLAWPMPPHIAAQVKRADMVMLATERRDLLADGPDWGIDLPDPAGFTIKPWSWDMAMDRYAERLEAILPTLYRRSA
jgi:5'-deoxynucleotidase YfbR-like HD superfamily hydrolase